MTPQVRDLNALIEQQKAAIAPQDALIQADIAANEASGAAQVAGLEAKKKTAFKGIEQVASDKNMFFSGFSPNAQAEYTAGTYLPALAELQSTIAGTRSQLLGKKAELGTGAYQRAIAQQDNDLAVLNDWNKMTAEQRFSASEADKARAATAIQNQLDRNTTTANQPTPIQNMAEALSSKTGEDGYVSQGTYGSLKNQWISGGYGNAAQFDQTFAGFRNPKNNQYRLG